MHPQAASLWRHPRWTLAILLASLGMLGPFSIDTYLPAFEGIARSTGATPVQLQQTLSGYLLGFAVMNLFHGALSDSFGRRPVVLGGLALFTLASVGCALSERIETLILFRALQGMSAGAGMVISRAVIRDLFPPDQAQRVMSQVTIFFGVAPAVAPLLGGYLYVHADWHAIFWFLSGVGALLWLVNWRLLPESLPPASVQPFALRPLMQGYSSLLRNRRFLLLVLASGVPFNGMFLYVLAAPTFLGQHLGFAPTQYFWFFVCSIGGIMGGAAWSGRLAGRIAPERQVRRGFSIMLAATLMNLLLNAFAPQHALWSLPLIGSFSLGWALMVPVVTLMVLDQAPDRRGMASSLQSAIAAAANALVAGALVPLVMHSLLGLALASAAALCVGLGAWAWVQRGNSPANTG
ncbi:DHA1 family bicyclomycin/chloramphenicol resistance-like MFS transporter [Inhella inkyongensis]|uniref:Bcr/CflA family efflux transporter n=1 Tax=Inhella inkyongensis TaxID=392593 RepID=A0A840RZK9_9BURK|nr:multidrug effflux MFS transporter [Inhella inkyongensis]MBB5203435.1 DHA1 family bicyclomycin/chloramphenicol resistance-like MFS transporter [Inhella inkyongensis]